MNWVSTFILFFSFGAVAAAFHLNILHVNDMHSRFTGTRRLFEPCELSPSCYGGFARVNGVAKEIYVQDPEHTLFLNAGDNFQGSALFSVFKSDVVKDVLNEMSFDAVTLGNHEFDERVPELNKFLRGIQAPMVCANIDLKKEIELVNGTSMTKWIIISKSGIKIGITGYITLTTKVASNPGNVEFLNIIDSVRKAVREAKASGAQITIVLGHGGYDIDQQIAAQVDEVDIVVGGHSHTFLYSGTPPDTDDIPLGPYPTMVKQSSGKVVPVVQAYKHTKYLGNFTVEFDEALNVVRAVGNPILLSPDKPQDPAVAAVVDGWMKKLDKFIPVNKLVTEFQSSASMSNCGLWECEIGNAFADALLSIAHQMGHPDCSIGAYNGGGIRNDIPVGNITCVELADVVVPLTNNVLVVEMDGKDIVDLLEAGIQWYDQTIVTSKGGFLQVSGLRVVYDVTKPAGHKVSSVLVRNKKSGRNVELDPDETYLVVINQHIYNRMVNFPVFNGRLFKTQTLNITDYKAAQMYLSRQPTYEPYLDGRIRVINQSSGNGSSKTLVTNSTTLLISLFALMWVALLN